mgnify:CR=1 FL=1
MQACSLAGTASYATALMPLPTAKAASVMVSWIFQRAGLARQFADAQWLPLAQSLLAGTYQALVRLLVAGSSRAGRQRFGGR